MIEVRQTEEYSDWFANLRDKQARVSELRIDYGPGYRVYFFQRGREVVILLAGGDKRTQQKDIQTALELVRNL